MPSDLPVRARSVIAFVIAGAGDATRVLLLKRGRPPLGAWCPVTGRIEAGEMAWQTALREIAEETGLTEGALFSTGIVDSFYDPSANAIEMLPVFLFLIEREAAISLDHSQSEYGWLTIEETLGRLTFTGHRLALATIQRDFIERTPDPLKRISP